MASISDRASDLDDLDDAQEPAPWDQRPVVGTSHGLPWWGAVLLGFGLAALGATIDLQVNGELTRLFDGSYLVSCVAAICWVRRKSLFGPMVQPPLILGIVIPSVVLYGSGIPDTADRLTRVLAIGNPLINAFPIMAIATIATLLIGVFRLIRERDPERSQRHESDEEDAEQEDAERTTRTRSVPGRDEASPATPPPGRRAAPQPDDARRQATERPPAASRRPPSPDHQSTARKPPLPPGPPHRQAPDPNRARPLDAEPNPPPVPPRPGTRPRRGDQPPPPPPARLRRPRARPPVDGEPGDPPPLPPRPPRRRPPPPSRPWELEDRP